MYENSNRRFFCSVAVILLLPSTPRTHAGDRESLLQDKEATRLLTVFGWNNSDDKKRDEAGLTKVPFKRCGAKGERGKDYTEYCVFRLPQEEIEITLISERFVKESHTLTWAESASEFGLSVKTVNGKHPTGLEGMGDGAMISNAHTIMKSVSLTIGTKTVAVAADNVTHIFNAHLNDDYCSAWRSSDGNYTIVEVMCSDGAASAIVQWVFKGADYLGCAWDGAP